MTPLTIVTVMSDLLAACVAAYDVDGAPSVPKRRFKAWAQPVWEGEQLTVTYAGLSSVSPFPLPGVRSQRSTTVPSVLLHIEVVRACWPAPQVSGPSKSMVPPASFTAATDLIAADAATLFSYIAPRAMKGGLFPSLPTINSAQDVALQTMIPIGPQSGIAGNRWPISVKLAVPGPVAPDE